MTERSVIAVASDRLVTHPAYQMLSAEPTSNMELLLIGKIPTNRVSVISNRSAAFDYVSKIKLCYTKILNF